MSIDPIFLVSVIVGTLIAFIVHEYAHAFAAYQLGDPTAKYEGRLTLNPLVHLDPFGSLMLIISTIVYRMPVGWAKPVRFEYDNLKSPFVDGGIIAMAGPFSNFLVCFILGVLGKTVLGISLPLACIISANLGFGLFNCFPFPALDGWKILQAFSPRSLAEKLRDIEQRTGIYGIVILLVCSPIIINPIFKPIYRSMMALLIGSPSLP